MTPVYASQVDHCPEEGRYGDCHSACIATLLDLPRDQVPLFFDGRPSEECWAHVRAFLLEYDLVEFDIAFSTEFELEEVLRSMKNTAPDAYYIVGVNTDSGVYHSVVCCGDEVVHDPSFEVDMSKYKKPDQSHWYVTFMVPRGLTRR